MKKALFTIMAVIVMFVFLALIGEGFFRIYGLFDKNRGLKNSMGTLNKKYHHVFKPHSKFRLVSSKSGEYDVPVSINNFGFRGKDISLEKKPDTLRIMAIGDSFTFGVGAKDDETIPVLIEQGLNAKGIKTEMINAGFGNYSPILHYLRLRDEYIEFKPDLVILFYDFSDLADDWRGERSAVYDKSGELVRCDPTYMNGKRDWWVTIVAHSRLCSYINNKLVRTIKKIQILGLSNYIKAKLSGKRAKSLIVAKETDYYKGLDPIEYDGYLLIRGRNQLPHITEHFKRSEKYLNKIKDILRQHDIPMVLVIYPYGIHVGPDQWGEGRVYWGFEKGKTYNDYYAFDILESYAKRNQIPCINLLPDFLKNKDKKLFFDLDGHFTPDADHIAAQTILNNNDFAYQVEEALKNKKDSLR